MIKDPAKLEAIATVATLPPLTDEKLSDLEENARDALRWGNNYADGVGLSCDELIALVLEVKAQRARRATTLEKLQALKGHRDPEYAHPAADEALLELVNDEAVRAAFEAVPRWYE